jgi:hypothetical protein
MNKIKTLSAMTILSVSIVTPVFAQDLSPTHLRRAHNELTEPFQAIFRTARRAKIESIGSTQRDPSRVGGEDAELHPASS